MANPDLTAVIAWLFLGIAAGFFIGIPVGYDRALKRCRREDAEREEREFRTEVRAALAQPQRR